MKLIIDENKEVINPARVQIKTSFGRLFRNKKAKIELKKSSSEKLVFTWDNYIGIVANLVSFNDEIISKDSVPFLSFRNAIRAAKLFSKGGNAWKLVLRMKDNNKFSSKYLIRNIIKFGSYLCYAAAPIFLLLGFISAIDPNNPIFDFIVSNEKSFIPFFAVLMYAYFLFELPSFIYRDELDGQTTGAHPPAYIFFVLTLAIIFTIYYLWPEG